MNFWSKGFTLLEALMGLATFCMMAAFLPLSILLFSSINLDSQRLQAMQFEVFSSQVKKEIRMSQMIDPQDNRLFLKKNSDSILYEQSGSNIRRRVNFTGNEILLQNVKAVQFEDIENGVTIKIEDTWGKNYLFKVRSFIQTGN